MKQFYLISRKFAFASAFSSERGTNGIRGSRTKRGSHQEARPCCRFFDRRAKKRVRYSQSTSKPMERSARPYRSFRKNLLPSRTDGWATFVLAGWPALSFSTSHFIHFNYSCPFPFSSFTLIWARTAIDRSFLGISVSYGKWWTGIFAPNAMARNLAGSFL